MTNPSQASSIFSTGTPLVSGRQMKANSVFRITQPAKNRNTPYCKQTRCGEKQTQLRIARYNTKLTSPDNTHFWHSTQQTDCTAAAQDIKQLLQEGIQIPGSAWAESVQLEREEDWINTCMLQSMVLKNWPMMKLARKLKNTLMPCTAHADYALQQHARISKVLPCSCDVDKTCTEVRKFLTKELASPVQWYESAVGAFHWAPAEASSLLVLCFQHATYALLVKWQIATCVPECQV